MSRVKNPPEKKRLSLDRDRRNVYGENDKSSRKSIRRSKQRSHMRLRHAANQALKDVKGEVDESAAMEAEALTRVRSVVLTHKAFRKRPDRPLREVIEAQKEKRLQHTGRNKTQS